MWKTPIIQVQSPIIDCKRFIAMLCYFSGKYPLNHSPFSAFPGSLDLPLFLGDLQRDGNGNGVEGEAKNSTTKYGKMITAG